MACDSITLGNGMACRLVCRFGIQPPTTTAIRTTSLSKTVWFRRACLSTLPTRQETLDCCGTASAAAFHRRVSPLRSSITNLEWAWRMTYLEQERRYCAQDTQCSIIRPAPKSAAAVLAMDRQV